MFSAGSSSVISLAIVTPSLQTMGTPKRFSISTHFDLGPSVTRTASESAVTPRRIFSRAADPNSTCLCVMGFSFDPLPADSPSVRFIHRCREIRRARHIQTTSTTSTITAATITNWSRIACTIASSPRRPTKHSRLVPRFGCPSSGLSAAKVTRSR
jgi:hypothetical protein